MSKNYLSEEEILRYVCDDGIPSDCESIASDLDSESESDVHQNEPENTALFSGDMNLPITLDDNVIDEYFSSYSEESVDTGSDKIIWNTTNNVKCDQQFCEYSGVTEHVKKIDNPDPYKLFTLFVNDTVISHIVFHTNLYATQKCKPFKPTTDEEIRCFLGLNLYMSINKKSSYRDYWSQDEDLHDSYISKLMPVKRFSFLLSHLHLNDNSLMPLPNHPNFDKLYKLRPFIDFLSQSFIDCYKPHRNVAVDESMVKFKGRSSMKQFMRDKPIKRGYKIWMLCDESAYNLKFQIYVGKDKNKVECGLGERVVLDLTSGLEGKNHIVYMDNFFSSLQLYEKLRNKNIFACGTVNPKRKGLPPLENEKNMLRGEFSFSVSNTGTAVYRWKDSKGVNILSTAHDPSEISTVKRKQKDGTRKTFTCPLAIQEYNCHMNFVDKFDRLKNEYKIDRKSKKWWMRLFFHFIDCCVTNAFIIHKEIDMQQYNNKDFKRTLYRTIFAARIVSTKKAGVILEDRPANTTNKKARVDVNVRLVSSSHQPTHMALPRRCALCSSKKNPVRSRWKCDVCDVALCLRSGKTCFNDFHSRKQL